ncbi:MAG: iron ABC transporter permease [Armatimonadota bacterium]|nr:iron ABC transporter permease [Armatimonadota bacterium]
MNISDTEVSLAAGGAAVGRGSRVAGGVAGWALRLAGVVVVALLGLPIVTVLASLIAPTDGAWARLAALTLPQYVTNTVWLLLGIGAGVFIIGVGTAWLVTMHRFPGRGLCEWVLLLPLAVPAYLLAYTYADLLQFTGPVQSALRAWAGWRAGDYWFPEIRSLGGAIAVMTCVFYPYVYLLARAAFLEQSVSVLEVSRTLGVGPWQTFVRVALPLARPGIVAGLALALMEVLADFGTVKHFEVATFTTGIYLTWFGLGSPVGAAKLAAGLLMFVLAVVGLERAFRGRRRFHPTAVRAPQSGGFALVGARGVAALAACLLPPLLGFGVPGIVLLWLALRDGDPAPGATFVALAARSFGLAALAALASVVVAAAIAYGVRQARGPVTLLAARVATIGYALPGSLIAVGVLLPFGRIDNAVDAWARVTFDRSTGLLLSGTVVVLVLAYLVRFLAVSYNAVDAGLSRIRPSMDEAARTLGHGAGSTLMRVHAPMMSGSLLAAGLLVFVDTLKELPATLILRPFNFDTLAIRVYQLASDERLAQASTAALVIVAVGLAPVIILSRAMVRVRPGAGRVNGL